MDYYKTYIEGSRTASFPAERVHEAMLWVAECLFSGPVGGCEDRKFDIGDLERVQCRAIHNHIKEGRVQWFTLEEDPGVLYLSVGEGLDRWWSGSEKQEKPAKNKYGSKNVNGRMLDKIQKDPLSRGWTSAQWASHLKCSAAAVVKTETWEKLRTLRDKQKAEKALRADRRRRAKGSDQRKAAGQS